MKGVLCDLDGVIYQQGQAIDGAAASLVAMSQQGLAVRFVTNNSTLCRKGIATRLAAMGVRVAPEHIFTPVVTAHHWLQGQGLSRLLVAMPEAAMADLGDWQPSPDRPQAVLIGDLGEAWDYQRLNELFQALMGANRPPLLSLGLTRYYRGDQGLRLDVGPMAKALEFASDCPLVITGKPAELIFTTACRDMDLAPEDCVMVGDDIRSDIHGAQLAGLKGVLVKTGKFRPEDLQGELRPDGVIDSVAALPDWLARHGR
ncbi:TIGR01458 family HAD-type hydrolase [Gallaecimonas sp. GXIMD4217]|uniref:TIGR01458 family HAD-type hydrolase n=1 Tax=Gallaecimonas sp. GXIMD4217 TaxID=3131927 RepID=UPI00311AD2DA